MFLLRLATRNLFRQMRRNILSMVSIVMGVFVMIIGAGFANGLDENAIRGQIDQAGHVEVVPAEYPASGIDHPIDKLYGLDAEEEAWLAANTEAWTSRVLLAPRLIKGRDALRVRMVGYDSAADEQLFARDRWTLEGELPETHPLGMVVGKGVAKLLDIEPGEVLVVEARTADGALNAMQLTVTGVVETQAYFFDRVGVMAPRTVVDQLALSEGKQSHVHVRLASRDASETFAAAAEERISTPVDARTWQEEVAPLMEAGQMRRTMFNFLGLALLAMAAVGIANTVLMAAFERVREIGTMRALGLTRRGVVAMFAFEGAWMGLVGGLLGAAMGAGLTWHYSTVGIDMMALMGAKGDAIEDMPLAAMLYLDFSPEFILGAVLAAVVIAVGASLYPAVVASRLLPADAVRAA